MAGHAHGSQGQANQMSVFDEREKRDRELDAAGLPKRPSLLVPVLQQFKNTMTGLDFVIDKTWDAKPIDHEPYTVHMEWKFEKVRNKAHKRVVKVYLDGPLMDEPEAPEGVGGYCPNLWDYEVFELFFANEHDQYLEVEIGPHGHWLVYLLNGVRKPFNKGEDLDIQMQNTFEGNNWRSVFEIPLAYFPPNVTKFNAYKIHGYPENRVYEALFPVTDGSYKEPDFHRLDFFGKLDREKIIPGGFNEAIFDDLHFGDLWTKGLFPNREIVLPEPLWQLEDPTPE